jgi:hypothetical protein
VRRYIQEKKFYATLPHKLDAEIERVYKEIHPQTKEELEWEWELIDDHPDGTELGWTLGFKYKKMDDQ